MELEKSRANEILNNCIEYLADLWEHDSNEEWDIHWRGVIGLSKEEMKELDLVRE